MQQRPSELNNSLYESFKMNYLNFASARGEIPSVYGFESYMSLLESKQGNGVLTESWNRISDSAKSDPEFKNVKTEDVERNIERLQRVIKEELRRLKK